MVNIWTLRVPSSMFSLFILHSEFFRTAFYKAHAYSKFPDGESAAVPGEPVQPRDAGWGNFTSWRGQAGCTFWFWKNKSVSYHHSVAPISK